MLQRARVILIGAEQVYIDDLKSSKNFAGIFSLREEAAKVNDDSYARELCCSNDEIMQLENFLNRDIDLVLEFVCNRSTILRQFNIDKQAKGVDGINTRREARDKCLKALEKLGNPPSVYCSFTKQMVSGKTSSSSIKDGNVKNTIMLVFRKQGELAAFKGKSVTVEHQSVRVIHYSRGLLFFTSSDNCILPKLQGELQPSSSLLLNMGRTVKIVGFGRMPSTTQVSLPLLLLEGAVSGM